MISLPFRTPWAENGTYSNHLLKKKRQNCTKNLHSKDSSLKLLHQSSINLIIFLGHNPNIIITSSYKALFYHILQIIPVF